MEALKSENLEAWQTKYELEGEMAAMKAAVEGAQQQHGSLLEVRQGRLWCKGVVGVRTWLNQGVI